MSRPDEASPEARLRAPAGVERTLLDALEILAEWEVPHLVAGSLAMQAYGLQRSVANVDLIVPDPDDCASFLIDIVAPFVRHHGSGETLRDERSGTLLHLLPAGQVLRVGCKLPFPIPTEVSATPIYLALEDLISLKLDCLANSPERADKDRADILDLIQRLDLPRDFRVAEAVIGDYQAIWDSAPGLMLSE